MYACTDAQVLGEAIAESRKDGLLWFPLGGGSNVLAPDEGFSGSVLLMRMSGLSFEERPDRKVLCTAGAGVDWNELVDETTARGLWGLENLAGIPGLAGASPIQNIGAYGVELSDTLSFVDIYDADSGKEYRLTSSECELAYRDSRFKREPNLLVIRIGLVLAKEARAQTTYKDIAQKKEEGADTSTPGAVARLVREIRSRKFPSLTEYGTAGSFFKNPIISKAEYAVLAEQYPDLPAYPAGERMKVSLAWILDNVLSLRGFSMNGVALFDRQPLVLVTCEGATAHAVDALAKEVSERVHDATGIVSEREVRALDARA